MSIVFYEYPMAPSPRRIRILLLEKQIPFESVTVDLVAGEHLTPAFRAISPTCTVPALKLEDGTVLTENAGIAAWAEAAWPEPPLLGTTPVEKGEIAMWTARIEYNGLMAVAESLRNSAPSLKDRSLTGPVNFPQIPALVERGLARLADFMDGLNNRLEGRDYIVGNQLSFADISALVTVDFARVVKVRPKPDHANIARWRAALSARPSFSG
jgi:glutathione S-transferase